jgi:glutamate 5-kinase
VEALWQRGKSLLPSGILEVVGDFDAGDLIGVEDLGRREFARGLARYGSAEIRQILGKRTSEVASILGRQEGAEVIHRDDLVVL